MCNFKYYHTNISKVNITMFRGFCVEIALELDSFEYDSIGKENWERMLSDRTEVEWPVWLTQWNTASGAPRESWDCWPRRWVDDTMSQSIKILTACEMRLDGRNVSWFDIPESVFDSALGGDREYDKCAHKIAEWTWSSESYLAAFPMSNTKRPNHLLNTKERPNQIIANTAWLTINVPTTYVIGNKADDPLLLCSPRTHP